MSASPETKWITVQEAAELLNHTVSLQTIYRLIHDGEVKGTKVRGRILIDKEAFDDYLRVNGFAVLCPARAKTAWRAATEASPVGRRRNSA